MKCLCDWALLFNRKGMTRTVERQNDENRTLGELIRIVQESEDQDERTKALGHLMRIVQGSGLAWERDAAMRVLERVIRGIALLLVNQLYLRMREEFVNSAGGYVFKKAKDRSEPVLDFLRWCTQILQSRLINEYLRPHAKRREHEIFCDPWDLLDVPAKTDELARRIWEIDREEPFGPSDMAQIQTWPVKSRVILLAVSDLWPKVPAEIWQSWCKEVAMPDDWRFPPNWPDLTTIERSQKLAVGLGQGSKTLKHRWERLSTLDFIQEQCEDVGFDLRGWSDFNLLKKKYPEKAGVWSALRGWFEKNRAKQYVELTVLNEALKDQVDHVSLALAIQIMRDHGMLTTAYRVRTPKGDFLEGDFAEPDQIPQELWDRHSGQRVSLEEGELVIGFRWGTADVA